MNGRRRATRNWAVSVESSAQRELDAERAPGLPPWSIRLCVFSYLAPSMLAARMRVADMAYKRIMLTLRSGYVGRDIAACERSLSHQTYRWISQVRLPNACKSGAIAKQRSGLWLQIKLRQLQCSMYSSYTGKWICGGTKYAIFQNFIQTTLILTWQNIVPARYRRVFGVIHKRHPCGKVKVDNGDHGREVWKSVRIA